MKALFPLLFISVSMFSMDKKDILIAHHHLKRHNSLPLIIPDIIRNVESAQSDEVTIISIPTQEETKKEESKTCCTKPHAMIIAACIAAAGITCTATLSAIVALTIHFAP